MNERRSADGIEAAQDFVEELLEVGFALGGAYASLLEDLPPDTFPGEDRGAVLLEMFAGSSLPALEAVSEAECRLAIALIGAVRDRILDDLRAAARLAAECRETG